MRLRCEPSFNCESEALPCSFAPGWWMRVKLGSHSLSAREKLAATHCVLATECERGRLHVSPDFGIVEIVDDAGEPLPPNLLQTAYAINRFFIREPERSRRVLRLVFANWLAHVEVPENRYRKPAVRAIYGRRRDQSTVVFYDAAGSAPAAALTGDRRRRR